ncbi:MAG TPA: hypothetical protein VK741_04735, partial [Acetobacteraceae bacterium]|nr:hypothetical protein [Acetobacteraceae bacterium]
MPLRLVRRPRRPHFYLRGTVNRREIFKSTKFADRTLAEHVRRQREAEPAVMPAAAGDAADLVALEIPLRVALGRAAADATARRKLRAPHLEASQC